MLKIVQSVSELDFPQFAKVCRESCQLDGKRNYPHLSDQEQLRRAEDDLYEYILLFLSDPGSFCAIWAPGGEYVAALRVERYRDGVIITGLETAPAARGMGFASALVEAVVSVLAQRGVRSVYSHVAKKNAVSLRVHQKSGFTQIMDYAVYLDGAVLSASCTLCKKISDAL